MKRGIQLIIILLGLSVNVIADNKYILISPNNSIKTEISIGKEISYTIVAGGQTLLHPTTISVETNQDTWGKGSKVKSVNRNSIKSTITPFFYKKDIIQDICNEIVFDFKKNFRLVFRAYEEGIAYRFESKTKTPFIVVNEQADFNFGENVNAYIPYVKKEGSFDVQYFNTFENIYTHSPINNWKDGQLAFLPIMIEGKNGYKMVITEANLEHYPGMFLINEDKSNRLNAKFAPYPRKLAQGSHDTSVTVGGHNEVVKERETYIAKCPEKQTLPWRIMAISKEDKDLLDNDLVYKLAQPSRIEDTSWIKPGKVAWEWWHDWNLEGVKFKTGVNTQTYKYYIDFASKNNIEYVILDEGWYDKNEGSIFAVVPTVDLEELIEYGKQKNVGIILWAGYYVFNKDYEKACKHYASMGVKGFKLDAIGRDDQLTNEFYYKTAALAAKYNLIVNYHGGAKPFGLNRTYPNVLNFEGVHGLEQLKNKNYQCDLVTYDVEMPFIRMVAGILDYTQGAMKNGTKQSYRSIWSEPMSQGTRCHQLAEYIVFESPLNMLCDSPTNYEKEPAYTSFVAQIPTVWKNTIAVNGKIGEYITIARKAKDCWYLGSLNNWDSRSLDVDLSFIGKGKFKATIYKDGVNANRIATDYIREELIIDTTKKFHIELASGGGFVMKIESL